MKLKIDYRYFRGSLNPHLQTLPVLMKQPIIIIIGRHAHVCIEPTSLNFTDTSRSDKLDLNKWGDTSELTLAEEQERHTGPLF